MRRLHAPAALQREIAVDDLFAVTLDCRAVSRNQGARCQSRFVRSARGHPRFCADIGQVDRQGRGLEVAICVLDGVDKGVGLSTRDRVGRRCVGVAAVSVERELAVIAVNLHPHVGVFSVNDRAASHHPNNNVAVPAISTRLVGTRVAVARIARRRIGDDVACGRATLGHAVRVRRHHRHVINDGDGQRAAGYIAITVHHHHAEVVGFRHICRISGRAGERVRPAISALGVGDHQRAGGGSDYAAIGHIHATHYKARQGVSTRVDREGAATDYADSKRRRTAGQAAFVDEAIVALRKHNINCRHRVVGQRNSGNSSRLVAVSIRDCVSEAI